MRLELFIKMGKVPPLGSIQDLVLREYLVKQLDKEFLVNKLKIQSSLPNMDVSSLISDLRKYTHMQFFLESHNLDIEKRMQDQYKRIKDSTPKLFRDKDGYAKVTGLVSHIL